jgi:hypothetical protein
VKEILKERCSKSRHLSNTKTDKLLTYLHNDSEELSDQSLGSDSEGDDSEGEQWQSQHINYEHAATKEAMDKLVAGLAPHEYGKMPPSFYNNSQKVAPTTVESDVVGSNTSHMNTLPEISNKPIREPILMRDKYEGVDSDDESDEEVEDDESEEERPQVIGEVDIDMGEEEEEFLEFARQTLGISDKQWNEILQDRKERNGLCALHFSCYWFAEIRHSFCSEKCEGA